MNSKGMAVLIAAIVILSSLFFFFHITIPNKATPPPPVKNPPPLNMSFFENQTVSPSVLNIDGAAAENFTFVSNATTKINGYLINASDGVPISGLIAWISLYPAAAQYLLASTGYYAFYALRAGSGLFLIKVPGYNEKVVTLDLTGKTIWLNLSLTPAQKYSVSGRTVYSNGTIASNVSITFTGYFDTFSTISSAAGIFSDNMYNDSYLITVSKKNVNPQPDPYIVNVTGKAISNLVLTLYSNNNQFNVSGWITNARGDFLSGATVSCPNDNNTTLTDSGGYYVLSVLKGYDTIIASMINYMPNETTVFVTKDLTDINLTLYNLNPYNGSGSPIGGGSYNSSQYLNNSSSNVNYSQKANYTLQGYINDSSDGLPVAYTLVNFIINVNGSYFDEQCITALNGSYSIGLSYPGTYHILVETGFYENKIINVTISAPVTTKNFTLVPLAKYLYTVSGTVTNFYSGVPIQNADVFARLFGSPQFAILNITAIDGTYSILLPESNYTLYAVAAGYQSNTTPMFHLSQNLTIDLELKPLGWNSQTWNGSGGTIPGENGSQIVQNLSGAGNYTSSALYNTTIQFINTSSGGYAAFTTFLIIYRIQGTDYFLIAESNKTGVVVLGNLEAGNYSFFVQSIPYEPAAFLINVSQNHTFVENLTPRYFIDLNVVLGDSEIAYGQNRSVPTQTFAVTNSVLLIPVNPLQGLNGTMFSIRGWNGTFNLSYVNQTFVTWNNSTTVQGAPVLLVSNVTPIGAMINYVSDSGWFYRSTYNSTAVFVAAGSGSVLVFLQLGLNGIAVNLSLGSHPYVFNFTLSTSKPVKQVYLNVTRQSQNVKLYAYQNDGNNIGTFVYNTTIPPKSEIYGFNVSFSLETNTEIYVNGLQQTFSYQNFTLAGENYSLVRLNPLSYGAGGNISITLITPVTSYGDLQVYYYEVEFT